jgi:hypothetical protein
MGFAETRDNCRAFRGAALLACEADQLQKIYGMNLTAHGEIGCDMRMSQDRDNMLRFFERRPATERPPASPLN